MTDQPKTPPLAPDRYPQCDMFICDPFDAAFKDDQAGMEHPFFSLSKKPDCRARYYAHNGQTMSIKPGEAGMPTIMDKDILIYSISQLMAAKEKGEPISQTINLNINDLLRVTNRPNGGRSYVLIHRAFERLKTTNIKTNIRTGGKIIEGGFSLINSWQIIREDTKKKRMISVQIELCKWIYNAVLDNDVLTLHKDYFRLRKPVERRLYELARKHCGRQVSWKISLEMLLKKAGSSTTKKDFRQQIKGIEAKQYLPDYLIRFDPENDMVEFAHRTTDMLATKNQELIGS